MTMSVPLYAVLVVIQSIQITLISESESIMDCFYTNVTLHLTGQLEILKLNIKTYANKPDTVENHRKQFAKFVDRHCELIELSHNLEDTFNLIILYQLLIVTLLLALLGMTIFVLNLSHNVWFLRDLQTITQIFTFSCQSPNKRTLFQGYGYYFAWGIMNMLY